MDNKKVLLVEDDPTMLSALKDALTNSDFEVLTAKNGEEGLSITTNKNPAIIILDILMPKMDGITMLKKLRALPQGRFLPVIVLTNISESDKLAEALEIGVNEYLIKTEVSLKEIVEKTRRILGVI